VAEGPDPAGNGEADAAEDGETDAAAGSTDPAAEARAGDRPAPAPVVGRAERFQVVVHVSAETLEGGQDRAAAPGAREESADGAGPPGAHVPRVAGGPHISAETARRLACDASVVGMVRGPGSEVLDVGRKRRTVPAALRRALERRDGGCRFPGCGSRFCDAHHIVPWAAGGETHLENLVLLCRHHHRRVHEDGWRVERVPGGGTRESRGRGDGFTFRRPDGRRVPRVPPPDPVPAHPAAALARAQRHLGIAGDTATPAWDGARMDVDWALCTLRRPAVPSPGVSAETPRAKAPTTEPRSQQETSPRRRRR
jgi:hypothetical protein